MTLSKEEQDKRCRLYQITSSHAYNPDLDPKKSTPLLAAIRKLNAGELHEIYQALNAARNEGRSIAMQTLIDNLQTLARDPVATKYDLPDDYTG